MKVDFFKQECRTITNEMKFGLCDDENNKEPAYINITDESTWIATVINDTAKKIEFTAIDNCINIFRENGEMERRCDTMISYENNLLFVELKTKRADWKAEGLNQKEVTINSMLEHNENYYYSFTKRKAIVANSKHRFPSFQDYDTEQREYFKDKYKIRIQYEAEIVIR